MTAQIDLKHGETLGLGLAFLNDQAQPVNLYSGVISAQVRDESGNLVASLTPLTGPVSGLAVICQSTSGWPIGSLSCDIKLQLGGVEDISDTFSIQIAPAVTQ